MSTNHVPVQGLLLALASAVLFGASTPFNKLLLSSVQELQLAGLIGFGSAAVALLVTLREEAIVLPWRIAGNGKFRIFSSMILGGVTGPVLLLLGLKMETAASVSMWLTFELVFTAALGALFFHEKLSRRGWLAYAFALIAALLFSVGKGSAGVSAGLLVATACLCWGIDNNAIAVPFGVCPAQIVFWKGLTSAVVLTPLAIWFQPFQTDIPTLALAVLVGMMSFGVSLILYIKASHLLRAIRTQVVYSSAPFAGLGLSVLLPLNEKISLIQIASAVILAVALLLLYKDGRERNADADADAA